MTPIDARADIIARLQAVFAGAERIPDIREHRGQFQSLEEVQTMAVRSPCILVAYRSFQNMSRRHDELYCQVLWAIHVVAGDTRAERRNALASGVALLVADTFAQQANTWEFADGYADALTAVDISTLALDQAGVSLWQIVWQQDCHFTPPSDTTLLTEFMGFDAEHFEPPANVTTDTPLAETSATYEE